MEMFAFLVWHTLKSSTEMLTWSDSRSHVLQPMCCMSRVLNCVVEVIFSSMRAACVRNKFDVKVSLDILFSRAICNNTFKVMQFP